jgi:phytoene dehydrogenase-like protein
VFAALAGGEDPARARNGGRAVTLSTHTAVEPWERAQRDGTLPSLRAEYAARLLRALDVALQPASAPVLIETGTPLTFEHYTAREHGLVGGVPQRPASANLRARSHRTRWRNLLCCGDTIFPGQSTVGVSLSAIACARSLGVTAAL